MELKQEFEETMAYKLYNYLLENHLGKENGIKRPQLAAKLEISTRTLRLLTKQINTDPRFEKLVSTTHSCYICKSKDECINTIRNTYKVAISLFQKAKTMEKRVGLNNQIKMPLEKEEVKEFVETFES